MEGTKVRKVRNLRVERNFEGARLERELLASAYERAVPTTALSIGGVADRPDVGKRADASEIPFAKGA
jgi:hypothetical protein